MKTRWVLVLALVIGADEPAGALDLARAEAGVDRARTAFRVTGAGVIVAIMDRGLDHAHPAFLHPDGTTRLRAMLDLTRDDGAQAEDNAVGVGTVLRQPEIDRAVREGTKLSTADDEGRGTASAGIACGDGVGSAGRRYGGVAPDATMLFVKLKADPSPWQREARGEEASVASEGEDAWFDLRRLRAGIAWCVHEAKAAGQPLVMVMNFGQMGGPTDGGSKLCRTIDETVGPGKPGVVFVTCPSDQGDRKNRARGTVAQGGTLVLPVVKEGEGELIVDLWYPGTDRLDVSIQTPKGRFGPFRAPKTGASEYTAEFQYYHLASSRNQVLTLGGKRQIRIDLIAGPGTYTITLHGAQITAGVVDAVLGPNPENPMDEPFNHFDAHVVPGSLWDGASAKHAIVPGCYVHRTEWKNLQGRGLAQLGEGKPGEIWLGSATGPTADGRPGITLCAPADRIATTYARDAEWATVRRHVLSDDDGAMYGLSSGTSASAAFVAGVVALMLEANPKLDAADVKALLEQTARRDEHTGAVPNPTWGYGKLDAYAAVGRAVKARRATK